MVEARNPCGAEWIRESRPEPFPNAVGGAGQLPRYQEARDPWRQRPSRGRVGCGSLTASNEGGTAERLLTPPSL